MCIECNNWGCLKSKTWMFDLKMGVFCEECKILSYRGLWSQLRIEFLIIHVANFLALLICWVFTFMFLISATLFQKWQLKGSHQLREVWEYLVAFPWTLMRMVKEWSLEDFHLSLLTLEGIFMRHLFQCIIGNELWLPIKNKLECMHWAM